MLTGTECTNNPVFAGSGAADGDFGVFEESFFKSNAVRFKDIPDPGLQ